LSHVYSNIGICVKVKVDPTGGIIDRFRLENSMEAKREACLRYGDPHFAAPSMHSSVLSPPPIHPSNSKTSNMSHSAIASNAIDDINVEENLFFLDNFICT
jgi:hypothetical protein